MQAGFSQTHLTINVQVYTADKLPRPLVDEFDLLLRAALLVGAVGITE